MVIYILITMAEENTANLLVNELTNTDQLFQKYSLL
jgi:hypothetical protein